MVKPSLMFNFSFAHIFRVPKKQTSKFVIYGVPKKLPTHRSKKKIKKISLELSPKNLQSMPTQKFFLSNFYFLPI